MRYHVMDGDNEIFQGDTVISFRGEPWTFQYVTRGPEYNGTAKVYVTHGESKREFYAHVFNLTVITED